MRILFVAMPHSIHTARWIDQITDQGWDIHLVPSIRAPLHPYLQGKVSYYDNSIKQIASAQRLAIKLLERWPHHRGSGYARRLRERIHPPLSAQGIEGIVRRLKPDIVHSLEVQHAGYLVLASKQRMQKALPPWIVTNWGSDVYLYSKLAAHKERVKQVLASCDYYACECTRDVGLAKRLGLRGEVLPVLPCGGGFDLDQYKPLRQAGPTSGRRIILLKGYQHWAGRALAGLRAIELCADVIRERGYRVIIQLASPNVQLAAELVAESTGLPIETAPYEDYLETMRRFGAARIHIGLSISDGISQSLLEAMVLGTFPIQSCTACANEWIEDGKSGFIVPPEDPHIIAQALRRALVDDDLVDQAAQINDETARRRLAHEIVKEQVVSMYESVCKAWERSPHAHHKFPL